MGIGKLSGHADKAQSIAGWAFYGFNWLFPAAVMSITASALWYWNSFGLAGALFGGAALVLMLSASAALLGIAYSSFKGTLPVKQLDGKARFLAKLDGAEQMEEAFEKAKRVIIARRDEFEALRIRLLNQEISHDEAEREFETIREKPSGIMDALKDEWIEAAGLFAGEEGSRWVWALQNASEMGNYVPNRGFVSMNHAMEIGAAEGKLKGLASLHEMAVPKFHDEQLQFLTKVREKFGA
ncbi:hypothetical protein [Bradyrhizobium guangzhouense]|uniref:Uncharacterized protein n=1 Tax=Bradyrhizobium guangzhouense TaxID=1325095 RepID=A0AAE5X604_9BRAD|nr:hypothetical protein [Bradyrhizobium guangzhouense]QAU49263.1 hypothetical protein XH91_30490 [Bradyrhizobium guangzhouense]RXH15960.1 hypothetical protein EAS56_08060 [Bradyrhizobium guangzhouense]